MVTKEIQAVGQKQSDRGLPRLEPAAKSARSARSRPSSLPLAVLRRRVRLRSRTPLCSEPLPSRSRRPPLPAVLSPVSEAVSTLTGSDQVLQGPW